MKDRRNSDFQNSLSSMYNSDIEKTGVSIAKFTAESAKSGALNGSRYWLEVQTRMIEGIINYKDSLLNALTAHDPEHSSIKSKDFELAKSSLISFKNFLKDRYLRKLSAAEAFGASFEFDDERVNRELNKCTAELDRAKHYFRSKRSFWKWAIGDTKRKIFSAILLAIGGVIGRLSTHSITEVRTYISNILS